MEIVLHYVGDQGEQRRYISNIPGTDLTADQVADVARTYQMEPDAVIAWLLSTGVWVDANAPAPEPAPAAQEG